MKGARTRTRAQAASILRKGTAQDKRMGTARLGTSARMGTARLGTAARGPVCARVLCFRCACACVRVRVRVFRVQS